MEIDRHEDRPGVPMEQSLAESRALQAARPHIAQQRATVPVLVGRDHLTPVFGTAQPPRGVSGILRRLAYRVPTHYRRHWLLLMLADRVDVDESALVDNVKRRPIASVAALAAIVFGLRALR